MLDDLIQVIQQKDYKLLGNNNNILNRYYCVF